MLACSSPGTTGIDGGRSLTTASRARIKLVKLIQKLTVNEKVDRLADSGVAKALRGLFGTQEEATYAYAYTA